MRLPDKPAIRAWAGLPAGRPVLAFADSDGTGLAVIPPLEAEARRLRGAGLLATVAGTVLSDVSGERPLYVAPLAGDDPQALRLQAAEALARLWRDGRAACTIVLPDIAADRAQAVSEGLFSANFPFPGDGLRTRGRWGHRRPACRLADQPRGARRPPSGDGTGQ